MDELERKPDRDAGPQRDDKPSGLAAPAPARRRLLTGGLSATGVVLTLSSRSVLGFECKSPSARGSASPSQKVRDGTMFNEAKNLAFWQNKDNKGEWPSVYVRGGLSATKFSDVFFGGTGDTLKNVLNNGNGSFEQELIVALFNVERGFVPSACIPLNTTGKAMLQAMWLARGGFFEPGNLNWNNGAVRAYLENNGFLGF